jgi:hypothetical protein
MSTSALHKTSESLSVPVADNQNNSNVDMLDKSVQNNETTNLNEQQNKIGPVLPSAKLPTFSNPKSKYKRQIYLNAVHFCVRKIIF